jgi:hypothetical protein
MFRQNGFTSFIIVGNLVEITELSFEKYEHSVKYC